MVHPRKFIPSKYTRYTVYMYVRIDYRSIALFITHYNSREFSFCAMHVNPNSGLSKINTAVVLIQ